MVANNLGWRGTFGQHAAALERFEASLQCKDDAYVRVLAFMESCASNNTNSARKWYRKLTAAQQSKFAQICIRQKPPVDYQGDPAPAYDRYEADDAGYLVLSTRPAAIVFIDGKDTGMWTPVTGRKLALSPGKHMVTLIIGEDRFTYPVKIEAGATARMTKDLR